jgi:hypothetical protein
MGNPSFKAYASIIAAIEFPGYGFRLSEEGEFLILRVLFTGEDGIEYVGRPVVLEFGLHPHQIITQAWVAIRNSFTDRYIKFFKYQDIQIVEPPLTINAMVELASFNAQNPERGVPFHRPLESLSPAMPGSYVTFRK